MVHPIDTHVGKRLRECRTVAGMSQQAIGDALGVSFQQVQKYETGTNRISSSRLYELSAILGVTVAYFFEEVQQGRAAIPALLSAPLPENINRRETLEMIRAYYGIPGEDARRGVFELIKALSKK